MVIQRWQTVLLLIAAVMMTLFSFCSLGQYQGAYITVNFTALSMTIEGTGQPYMSTAYLFVVGLLAALLCLIAIFRFKKPAAQRKIAWLALIVVVGATVATWICSRYAQVPGADGIGWSGIALSPFIAMVALLAAIRCISSDIKKLAGLDRLR